MVQRGGSDGCPEPNGRTSRTIARRRLAGSRGIVCPIRTAPDVSGGATAEPETGGTIRRGGRGAIGVPYVLSPQCRGSVPHRWFRRALAVVGKNHTSEISSVWPPAHSTSS